MKIQRIILAIITTVLVACSTDTNCLIADSIHPIKMINVDGSQYAIYLKISGFHDKVSFYELYKGKPIFDECGRPNVLAIAEEPVDPSLGAVSKLVIDAGRLRIVYAENKSQKVDLKKVPVEIKSLQHQINPADSEDSAADLIVMGKIAVKHAVNGRGQKNLERDG